jgi:hypothetical protein
LRDNWKKNQENDKNISIKRINTKNELKKQIQKKLEGMKLQK